MRNKHLVSLSVFVLAVDGELFCGVVGTQKDLKKAIAHHGDAKLVQEIKLMLLPAQAHALRTLQEIDTVTSKLGGQIVRDESGCDEAKSFTSLIGMIFSGGINLQASVTGTQKITALDAKEIKKRMERKKVK